MLGKLRPRSAYDVMAAIAFFIAVAGGSAYAAATIGSGDIKDNAVVSRHIKNGAVKNRDLGSNSVGTSKVIDGSLLKQDFKAGQLPRGPKGDKGDKGDNGQPGTAGPSAEMGGFSLPEDQLWRYAAPSGETTSLQAVSGGSETKVSQLSPNATIVARDFAVVLTVAAGGPDRTFTLRVNGAPTTVACTPAPLETSCTSPDTATIPPRSRLSIEARVNSAGLNPKATDVMFGWRATTP